MSTFPVNHVKCVDADSAKVACKQCGQCCVNNGLIPPLIPGEESPEWLSCLVARLRKEFAACAESFPCVFLTDACQCAIHDMDRPSICVDFTCEKADAEAAREKQ